VSEETAERDVRLEAPVFEEEYDITLPEGGDAEADQDQEWCEVEVDGETRKIRFHDYHEIYAIPGLYEQIFYEELKCQSPEVVGGLLIEQVESEGERPAELRVFDVGAGNGMVAEELRRHGATSFSGVDIIEEAASAAERDRPGLYEDYLVLDLTKIPPEARQQLEGKRFNCLVTVAALGFDDIPPRAFAEAYNLVEDGGFVAFNIKEDFVSLEDGGTGFAGLIRRMVEAGTVDVLAERRYRHRLSVAGRPLYYVAIVARKRGDVPERQLEGLDG